MPSNTDLVGHQPSNDPPYAAQDVHEVAEMVRELDGSQKNKGKKGGVVARKQTFAIEDSPDKISVVSWRMSDWDYKKAGLPTYARGLFTTHNRRREPEIVTRGYDKFFNTDEVNATKWPSIRAHTLPPYDLTLKENGCIIFISGLEDGTLLVCSKHSTGLRSNGMNISHSGAGLRSLEKQLEAVGRNKADLARELRARNATAVAELCDDSFEEHILEYGPEKAGLYLHGINLNLPRFATWPSDNVQQFARDWGFREIGVVTMQNVDEVKAFLEEAAETGAWGGRDVEGFVIRCKMSEKPGREPYHDWFFKYKFDEPYLMYRQWRECTKAMISGKSPTYRKHIKITKEYLLYARHRLQADPQLGKLYNNNHGIIALRDDFLAFKNLKGADAAAMEAEFSPDSRPEVSRDVLLVPISTIGCGKTTLALALQKLFPDWGHVQNDNIEGKGRPPRFTKMCCDLLEAASPVVVADRNNAQRHERRQIITDAKKQNANLILVALAYDHENLDQVRRMARERVLARGNNHQTIQAQTDPDKFIGIMDGFINRFEPCSPADQPDAGFDHVISLDPVAESRANLETVVTGLNKRYPNLVKELPSADQMDAAIEYALAYQPDMRHVIADRSRKKGPGAGKTESYSQAPAVKPAKLEYLLVEVPKDVVSRTLEKAFRGSSTATARFYTQLKRTRRVQPRFHVTLMHRATAKQRPELWERYSGLVETAAAETMGQGGAGAAGKTYGSVDVVLERVVFDDRVMAIVTRLVPHDDDDGGPWECFNQIPHVTVGTRDDGVKPKESNDLLTRWLEKGAGDGIEQVMFENGPVVKGRVKAVMSR